jgi:CheY-like chemotaxis protein
VALPRVLLIDDSEAVLAYERAALSGHYTVAAAVDAAEGLREMRSSRPDVVVLDLSMPRMDGDELLEVMWADPQLREVPVLVVSAEEARGQACVRAGAAAYLPKPVSAPDLLAAVNRVHDAAAARRSHENLLVLLARAGGIEVALPVDCVRSVLLQLPAVREPGAAEHVVIEGARMPLVDLAGCLGVPHAARLVDRRLAVVEHAGRLLALSADDLHGPEEVRAAASSPDASHIGVVRTARGERALLAPAALFQPEALAALRGLLERHVPASIPSGPHASIQEAPEELDRLRDAVLLDLRGRRAAQRAAQPVEEHSTWVARIESGGASFAIPLGSLLGVVPVGGLVPVPLSPRHVLGVVRFRGEVLAALSGAWLMGEELAGSPAERAAFVVAQSAGGRRFALDCERVPEPVLLREATRGGASVRLLDLDAAIARH